jgi:hypothetical protein
MNGLRDGTRTNDPDEEDEDDSLGKEALAMCLHLQHAKLTHLDEVRRPKRKQHNTLAKKLGRILE